eukprot:COSAG02_NODE_1144_length_14244_cov_16.832096_16_plen_88_part_00
MGIRVLVVAPEVQTEPAAGKLKLDTPGVIESLREDGSVCVRWDATGQSSCRPRGWYQLPTREDSNYLKLIIGVVVDNATCRTRFGNR